jgi:nucleoside-diphosphate-sugar epimerase
VHPSAANRTFLVSDCDNVSTTVLLLRLSKSMGKKLLLLRIPVFWLILGAKLIGKKEISNRLFESLEIDVSETQRVLGWQPVISMEKALEQMAQDL